MRPRDVLPSKHFTALKQVVLKSQRQEEVNANCTAQQSHSASTISLQLELEKPSMDYQSLLMECLALMQMHTVSMFRQPNSSFRLIIRTSADTLFRLVSKFNGETWIILHSNCSTCLTAGNLSCRLRHPQCISKHNNEIKAVQRASQVVLTPKPNTATCTQPQTTQLTTPRF